MTPRPDLLSEWCRCGAPQNKTPKDSTETYSLWCFIWGCAADAPLSQQILPVGGDGQEYLEVNAWHRS